MAKQNSLNDAHFLNQIAMEQTGPSQTVTTYKLLEKVYDFATMPELQDLFKQFCKSATSNQYLWEAGSPGNLMIFSQKIELLIECCYLISIRQKKPKKLVPINKCKTSRTPAVALLIISDASDSFEPLSRFFSLHSLPEWKLTLHNWTICALSNYSIVDTIDPVGILSFYQEINQLLENASQILNTASRKH